MAEPGQDTAPQGSLAPPGPHALPLSEEAARPLWLGALATLLLHGGLLALLLWPGQEASGGSGGGGGLYAIEILVEGGELPGAAAAAPEAPTGTEIGPAEDLPGEASATPPAPLPPSAPKAAAVASLPMPPPGPAPTLQVPAAPPAPTPPAGTTSAATEEPLAAAPPEKPAKPVAVPAPALVATTPVPTGAAPPAQATEPVAPDATGPAVAGQTASLASPAAGAGAGDIPASVGELGAARAAYEAAVLAWLQQHKRYPKAAERRRQQGVARVVFTLAPDGRVTDAALLETSGYAALDQEALALLGRAAPLPPFPASLPALPLTFTLPVDFSLR